MQEVPKGDPAFFFCPSDDKVLWTVPHSSPRSIIPSDQLGGMLIQNVQLHHAGIYRCHGIGKDVFSAQAELQVLGIK